MAGIDKTYTDSWKNYKELRDWACNQEVAFFDGTKEYPGDWIFDYEESDFGVERPIMNTPTWLDIFLIQNCPCEFVIDRMKGVYGDSYEKLKRENFPAKIPEDFKQNRKVVIRKIPGKSRWPVHKKPLDYKSYWWLQCDDINWDYNSDTKTWAHYDIRYPTNTSTAHIKSIRGVVKHLRNQFLPSGFTFRLSGGYIGESYEVLIK